MEDNKQQSQAAMNLIEPKLLKGFRDFLPAGEAVRERLIDTLKAAFARYGFVPIDTPALEYAEVLLRKSGGETEKQVFRFCDNGGRDVALRFDLTVPFARFTAMHRDELYFPFKRYHIAKVWRGEKPQAGRYREFTQCDFDTIGSDSAASDAETLLLMGEALTACLGCNGTGEQSVSIHVNHRGILTRFLTHIGAAEQAEGILRAIDRLAKVGAQKVRGEIEELLHDSGAADKVMEYISCNGQCGDAGGQSGDSGKAWDAVLEHISTLAGGEAEDTRRLAEVHEILNAAVDSSRKVRYVLDPSITRGLDYYTGIVFETFLDDLPSIGSVCSGGRYDNLAGLYMKDKLAGVGASVGLDRLIAALDTLQGENTEAGAVDVEVFADGKAAAAREAAAAAFRAAGLRAEAFPDEVKMGRQYTVAQKKGARYGAFVGDDGKVSLKILATREVHSGLTLDEAVKLAVQ